jgi:hypothetical protein
VTWSNNQTINMASTTKNPSLSSTTRPVKHKHSPGESENKRSKTDSSELPVPELDPSSEIDSWPRFLVIESTDSERNVSNLSKLSPFVIEKSIKGCIGTAVQVKKLQSGGLLVEVARRAQAENLLRLTSLASLSVSVQPHRGLNSSRGVIRTPELADMDPAELLAEMKRFGVIKVDRVSVARGGERKPTNTLILTFNTPSPPLSLKVAYLNIPVKPYIPGPLRCYRCQRYGHHQRTCKRQPVCFKCGSTEHEASDCSSEPKCTSCKGDHAVNFNQCPVWLREKEICRVKTLQNLSFPEARALVEGRQSTTSTAITYSAALKPKSVSIATQTDVTFCQCAPNYTIDTVTKSGCENRSTSTSDIRELTTHQEISISDHHMSASQSASGLASTRSSRGKSLSPRLGSRTAESTSPRAPPRERREEKVAHLAPQSGGNGPPQGGTVSQQSGATRKGVSTEPNKKGKPPFKLVEAPPNTKHNE